MCIICVYIQFWAKNMCVYTVLKGNVYKACIYSFKKWIYTLGRSRSKHNRSHCGRRSCSKQDPSKFCRGRRSSKQDPSQFCRGRRSYKQDPSQFCCGRSSIKKDPSKLCCGRSSSSFLIMPEPISLVCSLNKMTILH